MNFVSTCVFRGILIGIEKSGKVWTRKLGNEGECFKPESCGDWIELKTSVGRKPPEVKVLTEEDMLLYNHAVEVLNFLNQKTGKNFHANEVNLKFVRARVKEAGIDNARSVVAFKCREWGNDPKWRKYLRPATIFNATKFHQYLGELKIVKDKNES